MDKIARAFVALVFSLMCAVPAFAGIADGPLPVLVAGQATLHLYSVPGVIAGGDFGTYFSCTSTDTATMQVGVEVFGSGGGGPVNDATATSLSVPPGATVIFGTSASAEFSINISLGVGGLSKGSARILATSKKLACTAFIADRFNAPPTSMVHLDIISKVKQKGD